MMHLTFPIFNVDAAKHKLPFCIRFIQNGFPQYMVIHVAKLIQMSHLVGKQTMWFSNRSDTNRSVQLQKQARSLKFWS